MDPSLSSVVSTPLPPQTANAPASRGAAWIHALAAEGVQTAMGVRSVLCADVELGDEKAVAFAVVPDPTSRLPRASHGEMGLEQALALAACIHAVLAEDRSAATKRPILAIVDTPGQALGRFEEAHCISVACAAAVEAYALARRAGHPVLTLVVGGAFSGSFLAHGMQSDFILALGHPAVSMQAMTARSIARITRRTLAEVERTAAKVLPMSYAIADAHRLGIIDELLPLSSDSASTENVEQARTILNDHLQAVRSGKVHRASLRDNPHRAATVQVRDTMRAQWLAADAELAKHRA